MNNAQLHAEVKKLNKKTDKLENAVKSMLDDIANLSKIPMSSARDYLEKLK